MLAKPLFYRLEILKPLPFHSSLMLSNHLYYFLLVVKSTLSSLADVIGDWVFYFRTKNGDDGLDEFENPIYFFCIMSSVLSGLAVLSIILNNCSCLSGNSESVFKKNCLRRINWIMGFEIFLEDIPQVILTTMVLHEKRGGVWSPVAVFNVTTSAFNFTFNILDMLMPLDEVHIEAAKAEENGGN